MEIVQIAGLGIVASVLLLLLRKERPELAIGLTLVAGLMLFFLILPRLSQVVSAFTSLASESGIGPLYFGIILKVLAVSYIADFAAALCRDAGEELMASRVEMAGRVLILVSALPIVREVLDVIRSLLG
ncbi:MAG TPA: stage III sporulation protein AD [Firmicutes bacterium]|nr:stage III sporulation protein AD [Candidatus Fermentithermobacillaceae bacterium]